MMSLVILLLLLLIIAVSIIGYKRYKNNPSTLSRVVDSKIDQYHENKADKELKSMYTSGPLGITQGSVITLSQLLLAETSKDGLVIPKLESSYKVGAIGNVSALMSNITRVYLGEGDGTFIQFILDTLGNVKEAMIFNKVLSTNPNEDGWDYLVGDDGMIGLYEASIKKDDGEDVVYNRAFDPYNGENKRIPLVPYKELILCEDGTKVSADGGIMLYSRNVVDTTEYCLMQITKVDGETSADVFVGIIIQDESYFNVV